VYLPIFTKQIFRVPEKASPPPLLPTLHSAVQEVGEKWIFSSSSRSFGYGFEAVRIRVKTTIVTINYKNIVNKKK
jgi:hypothetical protein